MIFHTWGNLELYDMYAMRNDNEGISSQQQIDASLQFAFNNDIKMALKYQIYNEESDSLFSSALEHDNFALNASDTAGKPPTSDFILDGNIKLLELGLYDKQAQEYKGNYWTVGIGARYSFKSTSDSCGGLFFLLDRNQADSSGTGVFYSDVCQIGDWSVISALTSGNYLSFIQSAISYEVAPEDTTTEPSDTVSAIVYDQRNTLEFKILKSINPLYESNLLSFNLAHPSEINIVVFRPNGQLIADISKGNLPEGQHHITLQPSFFHTAGTYIVMLQANNKINIQKLVKY